MYKQHTCSRENCPRKNWPTRQKDMDLSLDVLFEIVRSSIHKYSDYDINKAAARALIAEWAEKLYEEFAKHYSVTEAQQQKYMNTLLTLVEVYPDDGLPRVALNELIANEKILINHQNNICTLPCKE